MPIHRVAAGDSILSLGKLYGILPHEIWNHPDNRALRARSREPSILFSGDRVTVPEKELGTEDSATESRHTFRCRNRTAWLKVRFVGAEGVRAGEPYRMTVGERDLAGTLDSEGMLAVRVPVDAQEAFVLVGEGDGEERFNLSIGHLDPLAEPRGIQQRLNNLGFFCGSEDNEIGPKTTAALMLFQEKHGLAVSGELDEATRVRISETHGS